MGSMLPDFFLRVNTKKSGRIEKNIFGHRSISLAAAEAVSHAFLD